MLFSSYIFPYNKDIVNLHYLFKSNCYKLFVFSVEKIKINVLQRLLIKNKKISVNLMSDKNISETPLTYKKTNINPSLSDMEFTWIDDY